MAGSSSDMVIRRVREAGICGLLNYLLSLSHQFPVHANLALTIELEMSTRVVPGAINVSVKYQLSGMV